MVEESQRKDLQQEDVEVDFNPEEELLQTLEQDLKELEAYIQDFWQFLPVPICYVNPVHNILDAAQSLARFSGYSATDLIGVDLGMLFKDKNAIESFKEKIIEKGVVVAERLDFLTKGKKEIPVEVSGMARKNEEGEVIGYFISIIDISESINFQKKLEEQVERKTQELQEKVEELEKFHKIAVGRELKMIELKEEIQRLKEELERSKTG